MLTPIAPSFHAFNDKWLIMNKYSIICFVQAFMKTAINHSKKHHVKAWKQKWDHKLNPVGALEFLMTTKNSRLVSRIKCWGLTFLQTIDKFAFVRVIAYITFWFFYKTCHITVKLHVYDLTFISWGAGDCGEIIADKAAKPVTTDQDCVSTFVSAKPLDIFKEASEQKPKDHLSLTLSKWFSSLD